LVDAVSALQPSRSMQFSSTIAEKISDVAALRKLRAGGRIR
jgi:hypothetical protein